MQFDNEKRNTRSRDGKNTRSLLLRLIVRAQPETETEFIL